MWYVFDNKGACISSCDSAPNTADLATREEITIQSEVLYNIAQIKWVDGTIQEIEKKPPVVHPPIGEEPVDEERLAVYEAMAAQEERLAAQAERIAALEAALKTKGGDSK
nr:MAG TPA: hypothetical protein [Caudoviricetes sp.]